MVLESLTDPLGAEQHPGRMFFYGFLYTSIAIILSMWIFYSNSNNNASLVMVFLTTLACVPLVYNTMKLEEQKDESIITENAILKEHTRALMFFIFLFFGMVVAFTAWYIGVGLVSDPVTPQDNVLFRLFGAQKEAYENINGPQGQVVGFAIHIDRFFMILFNNSKVLIFALLFSFVYGVGAIFILTWNASVIGYAIGLNIQSDIAALGTTSFLGWIKISAFGLLQYSIHGIPEILAYFVGGLAAGIISVAVMKRRLEPDKFKKILVDSSDLILIAFVLLIVAAFAEVFVTPIVFG